MISKLEARKILSVAMSSGADFAELYFENREDTVIKSRDCNVDAVTQLHIYGVGLYLLSGTKSVYLFSNDCSFSGLYALAKNAASILAEVGEEYKTPIIFSPQERLAINKAQVSPLNTDNAQKIKVIKDMNKAALNAGPRIGSLNAEYYDNVQRITIFNSEGLLAEDERTFSRVRLAGTVLHEGKGQFAFHDFVRPKGFEAFDEDYISFSTEVIKNMEDELKAGSLNKSCVLPVVFEKGSNGVFWHEACGHNLETTPGGLNGCFGKSLGKQIASEKVTLIDDGYLDGLCGSETIDDEGHFTQKNVLIDKGKMVSFMADRKGGRITGTGSTGSGRRQSYTFAPCARMHNTYLAAGTDDDEQMIKELDDGIFVTRMGGGSSGNNFSVAVQYGYRIRNGELAEPLSGITLSGLSSDIIKKIDRVGSVVEAEKGGGFCGGDSGLVQTTAFCPRFRVSSMNIGGTDND